MAVSKRKEKERLEKERIKKVGEKLLKEQMDSNPDVKKETQRLQNIDKNLSYENNRITELQSRILRAEKSPVRYNSDGNRFFPNGLDPERDKSFLQEYKGIVADKNKRSSTMKPLDYGKEAVENINRKNKQDASNSMRYPSFNSNPTSRTSREKLSEKYERSNIKVANKLFGENNKISEWSKVNLDKIAKKSRERQKTNYQQAREEYYNPGFKGKNSGYEYGTGRPVSEKAGEYFESMRKKRKNK